MLLFIHPHAVPNLFVIIIIIIITNFEESQLFMTA